MIGWRKGVKLVLSLILVLGLVLLGAYFYLEQQLSETSGLRQAQIFKIAKGQSAMQVLTSLKKQGVTLNVPAFKVLFKLRPHLAKFKAGTYEILPSMNRGQILQVFISGKEKLYSISLVEGLRWRDWMLQLQSHPQLIFDDKTVKTIAALESDLPSQSLEGWLLPDTYHFADGSNASLVITMAHQNLQLVLEEAWQNRALDLPYHSAFEGLIMASIIEKETGIAQERPRIAGVFVNRLNKNMRLQTDPTVIYGLGNDFDGDIKRKDLRTPTPYNTYVIKGLPPTAIAMASQLAIQAAFQPQATEELYFVAKGDGSHQFSLTLQEHNRAVRQYQLKIK
ncbi:MAG: endolytic transglycosylase MltG [Paraglaciecola sp.]|nr:endolytic transglycosylase MltG [Paraglaciecola sp.]